MKRLFWVGVGAAAGVLIARQVTRTAQALTPQSIAGSIAESITILGVAVRDFALEVRTGMSEREAVLTDVLGLDAGSADSPAGGVPPRDRGEPSGAG